MEDADEEAVAALLKVDVSVGCYSSRTLRSFKAKSRFR
jgi:hypothetical protein